MGRFQKNEIWRTIKGYRIDQMKQNSLVYWIDEKVGFHYIIVESLPQDQQDKIRPWLSGQTMPIIPGLEDKLCIYLSDYELFFEYYTKGKIAPVYD